MLAKITPQKSTQALWPSFPSGKKVRGAKIHAFFGHAPWVWCRKFPRGNDLKHPIRCLQFTWGLPPWHRCDSSFTVPNFQQLGIWKKNTKQPTTHHISEIKTHTLLLWTSSRNYINFSTHFVQLLQTPAFHCFGALDATIHNLILLFVQRQWGAGGAEGAATRKVGSTDRSQRVQDRYLTGDLRIPTYRGSKQLSSFC